MKKLIKRLKNEEGFTLIEMTIVIMVIAILLIVLVPNLTRVNDNVSGTTDKALEQTVEAQMILYEAKEGTKPDAKTLEEADYITEDQLESYEKLKGITP